MLPEGFPFHQFNYTSTVNTFTLPPPLRSNPGFATGTGDPRNGGLMDRPPKYDIISVINDVIFRSQCAGPEHPQK